jgi:hypothetical protein
MILQRIKNDDDEQRSVPAGAAPAQGGAGLQVVFFSRQKFKFKNGTEFAVSRSSSFPAKDFVQIIFGAKLANSEPFLFPAK